MDKQILETYLRDGLSTRQIEKLTGLDHRTISYWINKYELNKLSRYYKDGNYNFNKIDTKEKAYCLGFILGDGAIQQDGRTELVVSISDREILDFIQSVIGGHVIVDNHIDKKAKRFPRARLAKKINDIKKFTGGHYKKDRHYPIIRSDLEKYLLQGFFDADGCITWGWRKDKNRLWQKVSFTSQYKILEGVQQYLLKHLRIATKLKPKSKEKCFVLEFSSIDDVMTFYSHLYGDNDFVILKRKYSKFNALRLELEENGRNLSGQYRAEPTEWEGVETNGVVAIPLNNHDSIQDYTHVCS